MFLSFVTLHNYVSVPISSSWIKHHLTHHVLITYLSTRVQCVLISHIRYKRTYDYIIDSHEEFLNEYPKCIYIKFIVPSQGLSDSDKSLWPLQACLLVPFGALEHFVTLALYLSLASPDGTTLFRSSYKSPSATVVP